MFLYYNIKETEPSQIICSLELSRYSEAEACCLYLYLILIVVHSAKI